MENKNILIISASVLVLIGALLYFGLGTTGQAVANTQDLPTILVDDGDFDKDGVINVRDESPLNPLVSGSLPDGSTSDVFKNLVTDSDSDGITNFVEKLHPSQMSFYLMTGNLILSPLVPANSVSNIADATIDNQKSLKLFVPTDEPQSEFILEFETYYQPEPAIPVRVARSLGIVQDFDNDGVADDNAEILPLATLMDPETFGINSEDGFSSTSIGSLYIGEKRKILQALNEDFTVANEVIFINKLQVNPSNQDELIFEFSMVGGGIGLEGIVLAHVVFDSSTGSAIRARILDFDDFEDSGNTELKSALIVRGLDLRVDGTIRTISGEDQ